MARTGEVDTQRPVYFDATLQGRSPQASRLLGAARDLFAKQGALATTVREITSACGLSPGALYNHFGSKDELLYVLLFLIHTNLEERVIEAQSKAGGNPVAELEAIVRVYVEAHSRGRDSARVANRDYTRLTGDWREEIVAIRRRLRDRVSAIVATGQERGVFHLAGGTGRAAATVAASTILDMCIHLSEWFHDGRPLTLSEMEDSYVEMALRIVGAGVAAAR